MINLRHAFRTLFKTPFVTTVAVISLALGIGTNTAIFSLFDELLLRPLPVTEPERLVDLGAPGTKFGSTSCSQAGECSEVFSYPMFRDLERAQTVFTGLAAHRGFGVNLSYHGQTLNGPGMMVSGSYFPVLGLRPALGRLLTPEDDRAVGTHYVTVLGYSYWETKLGANPSVLNEQIVVNGHSMTIVGVAPRDFDGTTLGSRPRLFVPISMHELMTPGWKGFDNRRSYWAYLFARLKPGVSIEQALRAMNGIYKPIINDIEAPLQEGMSAPTMKRFKAREITITDGRRGQSSLHAETRTPLILLFGITGIVLAIACANIANLLLARAASRSMEMAVRLSLGANRAQLLSQLLAESILLAIIGGAASLIVSRWTLQTISTALPADATGVMHFELRTTVVLFTAAVSLATGLLFGLFPALNSTRPDLVTSIRANAGQIVGAHAAARFRSVLVTAQIALSMALLILAGLFIRSLVNVSHVDLGIRVDNLVAFGLSPELNGYKPSATRALFQRVEEELGAIPGVTGVTASLVPVLGGDNYNNSVAVEGFKRDPDTNADASTSKVGAGYFRTMGVQLLAGREFTAADAAGAPNVAIVNEAFAKKFNLGRNAVGKHMGFDTKKPLNIEIVGLVKNAKYSEVTQEFPPVYVTPYRQDTTVGSINFYVRSSLPTTQLLRAIPPVLKKLDPNLPVEDLKTMKQQVRENVALDRLISVLSAAFAALATVLAAVGLYGVLAYSVALRTKEIGVRMALGADGPRVRGMVLWQVARMTLVGGVIGIAGALALGRAARSLLYGLEGYDPFVVVLASVLLTLVALAAGFIPAYRASRITPMQALRYE